MRYVICYIFMKGEIKWCVWFSWLMIVILFKLFYLNVYEELMDCFGWKI